MPGPLRYADAARLLGGNGPVFDALDRAVSGALTTAVGPAPELGPVAKVLVKATR